MKEKFNMLQMNFQEIDWLASQLSCKSFMNCWYTVSRVSLESNL